MYKKKAIIVSGYFNPIHKGHLELLQKCSQIGDEVWVIVNSDLQRELKGSKPFMDQYERLEYLKELRIIDDVVISNSKSAEDVIKLIKPDFYVKNPEFYIKNSR